MLDVKEVIVAQSVYDSTEEGVAESNTQLWAAGVIYITVTCNEGDDLMEPSAARTILWDNDSPELPTLESYRWEKRGRISSEPAPIPTSC